jgi:hypothetical protein
MMPVIETMDDPHEALENVRESLVLSFELSRERRRFTLVCSYPFKLPGADCALAGFAFDEVSDFSREEGGMADLGRFEEQFHARALTMPIVIESIKATRVADERHLDLWLGYSFGGVQFRYRVVNAYLRNALARQVDGEWLCRDLDSQEEYDFYDPFPDLMKASRQMTQARRPSGGT